MQQNDTIDEIMAVAETYDSAELLQMVQDLLCRNTDDQNKDILQRINERRPLVDEEMDHCDDPEGEYDGQPDEAQEWHDFDPDC